MFESNQGTDNLLEEKQICNDTLSLDTKFFFK